MKTKTWFDVHRVSLVLAVAVLAIGAAAAPAIYDYPDHGVLNMTKDELKSAPTFSYASEKK